jgi:PKD repeat protein
MNRRLLVILVSTLMFMVALNGIVAGSTPGDQEDSSQEEGGVDDGIMADTTPPSFLAQYRTPQYPGPTTKVDVTTVLRDESNPIDVKVAYGYDASNWTWLNATKSGVYPVTFTDRNPSSGTQYGGTLARTYTLYGELDYLNVYIYSSDHDTCRLRIRGYKESTSTWEDIYYSTSTNDGVKVNSHLKGLGYTAWDINFRDNENNDRLYYNCTYKVLYDGYTAQIPAAGSNPTVYYFFKASDPSGNNATSSVYSYTLDTTAPTVTNYTQLTSFTRSAWPLPIYTNASDNNRMGSAYINWSTDNSTWHLAPMSMVSQSGSSAQFMGGLPVPVNNTTVYYRVLIQDEGGNRANSSLVSLRWNPPPRIANVRHRPQNPNGFDSVNISAKVTDADGLSNVTIQYSTNKVNWTDGTVSKTGSIYYIKVPAGTGSPYTYYRIKTKDSDGGTNETPMVQYLTDKTAPRIYTPTSYPTYPNASIPIWVVANVTDNVGLKTVRVIYSFDNGATWSNVTMSQASNATSLTVGGYVRTSSSAYYQGLMALGQVLGTWNTTVSGYGSTPSSALFTAVDCILLDGAGATFYASQGLAAAQAGKFVVTNRYTWNSARSALGNPSFTSYSSYGFTSYGLSTGRGAIVYTTNIVNNNYIGYSSNQYNTTVRSNLAKHLKDIHGAYMPYGGQIPKTTTSKKVLYKINATDISNLSTQSTNYEYTTDGSAPKVIAAGGVPSPAGWDQSKTFPVWVNVTDETYLGPVYVRYTTNSGTTWTSITLTRTWGNSTAANYSGNIPATVTSQWVSFYYLVYDRAMNPTRYPSTSYSYQTSDAPVISSVGYSPSNPGGTTNVTVTGTVVDPNVVNNVELWYRFGSGNWSLVNMTAGTNDRWSGTIPGPKKTGTMYYYLKAMDKVGVWTTSTTYSYYVDGEPPSVAIRSITPQYPSATTNVGVEGYAYDTGSLTTVSLQYRYGNGTISTVGLGTTTRSILNDRNPASGTRRGVTLSKTYSFDGVLEYLYVYCYSSDSDTLYVNIEGYNATSSAWERIYYQNSYSPGTGVKVNSIIKSDGYTQWRISYRDYENNDYIYYSCTYWVLSTKFTGTIPGPGYSTWVHYRLVATDESSNTKTTSWAKYWADGTGPSLVAHSQKGIHPAASDVALGAIFADEHAIDRAELKYSYEGTFHTQALTSTASNTTHLTIAHSLKATLIPMRVTYYFTVYDKAGNGNDTQQFSYTTYMEPVDEGKVKTYSAGRLESTAGYKAWEWDFDYGGTFAADRSGASVQWRYLDHGNFTAALRVTDNNDAVTIRTFTMPVLDLAPRAAIRSVGTPYEGDAVAFDGSGSYSWPDSVAKYEWDFDYDGAFQADATGIRPNHTFLANRSYTVALLVTDDDGSTNLTTRVVVVLDRAPVAKVEAPEAVDEGAQVRFDATGTTSWPDALDRFEWDFDYDGTFSVDAQGNVTNHVYLDDGKYDFVVKIYDSDGSMSRYQGRITVRDLAPTSSFTFTGSSDEGGPTAFNASGSFSYPDEIVEYEWDFHHGGSFNVEATGEKANFTYMDHGNYMVGLRVTDDDGSYCLTVLEVLVRDLIPVPVLVGPNATEEGTPILLDASLSTSYPDELVSYEWDLSYDGVSFNIDYTEAVVNHTYMDNGTYLVALRLTDDDGSTVLADMLVMVSDLAPVSNLTVTGPMLEGSPVTLNGSASSSFPDELVSWEWDVDYDGTFQVDASGPSGEYTYMDNGTYLVALRVTDDDGSVILATLELTILDLGPTAGIEVDREVLPEGEELFLNTSPTSSYPDEVVYYEWDWDGDGVYDEETANTTTTHVFTAPGNYTVVLQVTDDDGSQHIATVLIGVTDVGPTANAGGPYVVDEGAVLNLSAANSSEPGGNFEAFWWDLDGDGEFDLESPVPVINWTWEVAGEYNGTLWVVDADGSTDGVNFTVSVTDLEPTFKLQLPDGLEETEDGTFALINLTDPGTEVFEVRWFFGDGSTSEGEQVVHAYSEQGTYELSLEVKDNDLRVHKWTLPDPVVVTNKAPDIVLEGTVYHATEDQVFTLTIQAEDTPDDTITFSFEGPGGNLDENTGIFRWTPVDDDVGRNTFTFVASDEDGDQGELVVTIDVEDVDNDFLGLSTAGGSLLLLVIVIIVVVAVVIYMRWRGMGPPEIEVDWEEMD